jgi:hypothetical protein
MIILLVFDNILIIELASWLSDETFISSLCVLTFKTFRIYKLYFIGREKDNGLMNRTVRRKNFVFVHFSSFGGNCRHEVICGSLLMGKRGRISDDRFSIHLVRRVRGHFKFAQRFSFLTGSSLGKS